MTATLTTNNLAAVISAKVDRHYGSVRAFILDVQEHLADAGIDLGYRRISRIYLRWQQDDADGLDTMPVDRTMRDDPTGEKAVRNLMKGLLA